MHRKSATTGAFPIERVIDVRNSEWSWKAGERCSTEARHVRMAVQHNWRQWCNHHGRRWYVHNSCAEILVINIFQAWGFLSRLGKSLLILLKPSLVLNAMMRIFQYLVVTKICQWVLRPRLPLSTTDLSVAGKCLSYHTLQNYWPLFESILFLWRDCGSKFL